MLKRSIMLIAVLLVAAFIGLTGCQQAAVTDNVAPLDPLSLRALNSENGTIQLDLSDDVQYQFVKDRINTNYPNSRSNSSPLLTKIEALRKTHIEKGVPAETSRAVNNPHLNEDHFARVQTVSGNLILFAGVTVHQGSPYTFVDFQAYDLNGKALGRYAWAEYYDDGTFAGDTNSGLTNLNKAFATITIANPYPAGQVNMIYVKSYQLYEVNGVQKDSYTVNMCAVGVPAGNAHVMNVMEPLDKDNNGVINIEVDRSIGKLADYQKTPYSEAYQGLQIPFKGVLRVGKIAGKLISKTDLVASGTYLKILPAGCGGTIDLTTNGVYSGGFYSSLTWDYNYDASGKAISTNFYWNIPRESSFFPDFPSYPFFYPNRAQAGRGIGLDWFLNIAINVNGNVVNLGGSTADLETPLGTQITLLDKNLKKMAFWFSCLAEGSLIRMADGSLIPVEKVREGDVVKTATGINLTVIATAVGQEKNMIRIVDEYVHSLLLTDFHPVKTLNRGILPAIDLKAGDVVETENGPAQLVIVKKESYNGKVYNLFLSTKEEAKIMPENGNMFYAQGILVGDGNMQAGCRNCLQNY